MKSADKLEDALGAGSFHALQLKERDEEIQRLRAQNAELQERLNSQVLAKHQPCGCITCTCGDEAQCHGCGAENCGTHPVGEIPNPVYDESQLQQRGMGDASNMPAFRISHLTGAPRFLSMTTKNAEDYEEETWLYAAPQPPETMQWISVDKHLPKDSEGVLMYLSTGAIYSGSGEVLKNTNASEEPRVGTRAKYTHWMPLPAAPQDQREGECCCGETEKAWRLCPEHGPQEQREGGK